MDLKKILIVDDAEQNRELLADILSENYIVDTACSGKEAIEKLKNCNDYSLILLDLIMPEIDGFGVLDFISENGLTLIHPVIIISGDTNTETESRCFDYNIVDFIAKPFKEKVVLKRVENVISLNEYQKVLESELTRQHTELEVQYSILVDQAKQLQKTNEKIIEILGNMVESRDLESGTHVKRVCGFTKILGLQYMEDYPKEGLTEERIELISKAAAMHDIGKISIPDNILLKPGKLTPEEFNIMKSHTTKGCELLDKIDDIWDEDYQKVSNEICRYHHERFDGNGYPEKLAGSEIPLSAQLVSIADVYDALVTDRVYKKAYSTQKAYEMITNGECGQFSPKLLNSFSKVRSKFEKYVADVI